MRKFLIFITLLLLITSLCFIRWSRAEDAVLSRTDLEKEYLASFLPTADGLSIQFKGSGAKCQIIRNGKPTGISEYNQRIFIKPSETVELAFKNATLSFRRLTGDLVKQGFLVEATGAHVAPDGSVSKRAAIAILARKNNGTPEVEFFSQNSTAAEIKAGLESNQSKPIAPPH